MHEPTHAPGWRGRPVSYIDLKSADADALNPFEIFVTFGCVIGAAVALAAAAIAWTPVILVWATAL